MTEIFNGIFDLTGASVISVADFMICLCSALLLGVALALVCTRKTVASKSFTVTAAIIPAIV